MGAPIAGMIIMGIVQSVMAMSTVSPTLSKQFSVLADLAVVTCLVPYILALSALPVMMRNAGADRSTYQRTLIVALIAMIYSIYSIYEAGLDAVMGGMLVLAIGLVVDDAIVVVEAVERHIEDGMAPKDAALKAMEEISGPVVGIALVLSAVFVPTAFIPGITGRLYQQFAVTIAISVLLSAFNALTLSPALAALLLRPKKPSRGLLRMVFDGFNRLFERATNVYVQVCAALIRKSAVALIMLVGFGVGAWFFSSKIPSSFLPDEDQGYLYVNLQLPSAASTERTDLVARKIEDILAHTPGVATTTTVVGFSLLSFTRSTYNAFFWVTLKPWDERTDRESQFQVIKARLNRALSQLPEGIAFDFSPPAIPGVGTSGGFTFVLEDRAGKDIQFLANNLNTFLAAARKRPEIAGVSTTFLGSVPQQFINVDRDKVIKQGVPISDVYRTIQAFMGGLFINYFNRFGRQWQVYIEAEGDYRTNAANVGQFYVRNQNGGMVPLSALTSFEPRSGPEFTMRFNLYRAAQINGSASPGYSSDQAMAALEEVFAAPSRTRGSPRGMARTRSPRNSPAGAFPGSPPAYASRRPRPAGRSSAGPPGSCARRPPPGQGWPPQVRGQPRAPGRGSGRAGGPATVRSGGGRSGDRPQSRRPHRPPGSRY